ncbi:MAG: glycosyltransferase family 39 protein [Actinobacteria bacterium]|nr:glycosyltransferase family 39 protein [Actinomycetota bacterium]
MAQVRIASDDDATAEGAPAPSDRSARPGPRPKPSGGRRRWPGRRPAVEALGLVALVAGSLALRLEGLEVSLWLDEGISVGIASHPLVDIPALLVQDGSPPLYYLLLHGWMNLFGDSAVAVRSLSLLFALAMVPAAYFAGRSLFGRRAGWIAATLAATSPYLSYWGREARMYTLLALVSLVAVTSLLHVFAFRRPRRRHWLAVLTVSLALVLYIHNWGLHLVAAAALATTACWFVRPDRRRVLVDAAIAFGGAALLYAPWVPSLWRQLRETGAPWSVAPIPREAVSAVGSVLGDERVLVALLVAAGAPLVRLALQSHSGEGRAATSLAVLCGATVVLAWTVAQFAPGWSPRYFGIFLAPLLVVAALGLSRGGATGLVAFALIVLFWTQPLSRLAGIRPTPAPNEKSNAAEVAETVVPMANPGDLVISTQFEHVPLLHYYFGDDLRYATPLGLVPDPQVVDWRNALQRLQASTPATGLDPLLDDLDRGDQVFLVCPLLTTGPDALPWFRIMDLRCRSWREALDGDPAMALRLDQYPPLDQEDPGSGVFVLGYEKVA